MACSGIQRLEGKEVQSNNPLQQPDTGGASEAAFPSEFSSDVRGAKLLIDGNSDRGAVFAAGDSQFLMIAAEPAERMADSTQDAAHFVLGSQPPDCSDCWQIPLEVMADRGRNDPSGKI